MLMAKKVIIEFPSNLGLIEPGPGLEPGVKRLPDWLRKFNFHDLVQPDKVYRVDPPPYSMCIDRDSGIRNAEAISVYAMQQVPVIKKQILEKTFSIVLGGDCSILIGNALALKGNGKFGLFFLDGHTDFMGTALSTTKGAAGMDLAIATGNGHAKLSNILNRGPYLEEAYVWCVGNREFDALYVKTITDSKIHYTDLIKLRETGIKNCCHFFLKMADLNNLDGFWIHLDVDVLDDELMPAVDSRNPGGLNYNELKEILSLLLTSEKAYGIEITILDPDLDPEGIYAKEFTNEIGPLLREYGKIYSQIS
jgi:arginase